MYPDVNPILSLAKKTVVLYHNSIPYKDFPAALLT